MNVIRPSQRWRNQVVDLVSSGLGPRDSVFLEYFPLKRNWNGFVPGIRFSAYFLSSRQQGRAGGKPGIGNRNKLVRGRLPLAANT